jgi:tryptophan-rich sensory protein
LERGLPSLRVRRERFEIVTSVAPARANRRGLVRSVAITLAIAVLTNGALAALGFNRAGAQKWPSFAPPGPAIGFVWVALFAGMGAARWFALTSGRANAKDDARSVTILIALCLAYPFYTHAIRGHATELCGNIVTFAYATWLVQRLATRSSIAAFFIGTVALWVAFATALVVALVRLNGWAT